MTASPVLISMRVPRTRALPRSPAPTLRLRVPASLVTRVPRVTAATASPVLISMLVPQTHALPGSPAPTLRLQAPASLVARARRVTAVTVLPAPTMTNVRLPMVAVTLTLSAPTHPADGRVHVSRGSRGTDSPVSRVLTNVAYPVTRNARPASIVRAALTQIAVTFGANGYHVHLDRVKTR